MHRARLTFAAAACLFATGAAAATRPTDAEISDLVAKYSAAAIADREDIHKNPELSNRETRTGAPHPESTSISAAKTPARTAGPGKPVCMDRAVFYPATEPPASGRTDARPPG